MGHATYVSLLKRLHADSDPAYLLSLPPELLGPESLLGEDNKPYPNPARLSHARILGYLDTNGKLPHPAALQTLLLDASSNPMEDALDAPELRKRLAKAAMQDVYRASVIPLNMALAGLEPQEHADRLSALAAEAERLVALFAGRTKPVKASDLARAVVDRIESGCFESSSFVFGFPTLNEWAKGALVAGELLGIFGRPGDG